MKFRILFVCCLSLLVASAEKHPFDRYQSILDRQMFGPLPPGFDPTKLPSEVSKSTSADEKQLTQEQEKLQSAIHFSMINLTPEGVTEVGFTDNSDPKVPVNYLLKVGESRNGWTVKEADAVAATMTVAKGDIEVSLSLGGNSAAQANATSRSGGAASSAGAARPSAFAPGQRPGLLGGSLRARRLQRQQAAAADEAKRKEEQAAREAERQAQAEQEKAQREAERAEQRQQLLAIQEELKKVREAKAAAAAKSEEESNADN